MTDLTDKLPETIEDDPLEESQTSFSLFRQYQEGKLDFDVLSSQRTSRPTKPPVVTTTISSTSAEPLVSSSGNPTHPLPRSWCAPQPVPGTSTSFTNKPHPTAASFGAICKTQIAVPVPVETAQPVVTRIPYGKDVKEGILAKSIKSGGGNAILVNERQRGNPLLKHIHNVAWEYADIEPDYVVGRNHCVYFLSLRYHNLNPEYIFERVRQTKNKYQLSVLLTQVDVTDSHYPLKELCKFCLAEQLTLMLASNPEEAARYLEAYKALENKPPDELMHEAVPATDHTAQVSDFLTSVRLITKADVASAMQKFKTVSEIVQAEESELEACPGFGKRKTRKLYDILRMPFKRELT
ncbi:unnamed protein product [Calicophoron daubneyi]|uniref:ERCC1-like central domain-containing protein n=1 Tax=Calicophoron daubneyi TaxID=300641 RepID=A0AAV2TF77_CALDB